MTRPTRPPLRFVAIACAAAALAFGPLSTFAQSGIGGSSPTTGTTAPPPHTHTHSHTLSYPDSPCL